MFAPQPSPTFPEAMAFVIRDKIAVTGTSIATLAKVTGIKQERLDDCLQNSELFTVNELYKVTEALRLSHTGTYRLADTIVASKTFPAVDPLPSATPCPEWCADAPEHPWDINEEGYEPRGDRHHRQVTGRIPTPEADAVVAVEVYDTTTDGQTGAYVEISEDESCGYVLLVTPEAVAQFIDAVHRAAAIAFSGPAQRPQAVNQ